VSGRPGCLACHGVCQARGSVRPGGLAGKKFYQARVSGRPGVTLAKVYLSGHEVWQERGSERPWAWQARGPGRPLVPAGQAFWQAIRLADQGVRQAIQSDRPGCLEGQVASCAGLRSTQT
jgi:hypothetical protein